MHPLLVIVKVDGSTYTCIPLSFRHVQVSADYYRYTYSVYFPMTVVLWNRLPADSVVLGDYDSFKEKWARSVIYGHRK